MGWILGGAVIVSALTALYAFLGKGLAAQELRAKLPTVVGLILTLSSAFLPWVEHGGPAAFRANMDDLAKGLRLGDFADWAPELPQLLGVEENDIKSGDALIQALTSKGYGFLCDGPRMEGGFLCDPLPQEGKHSGWMVGRYARYTNKALSAFLISLVVGVGVLLIANLVMVIMRDKALNRVVCLATAGFAVAILVGLLWYLPMFDTLGNRDDLLLRILLVAGETRVAGGIWLAVIGTLALFAGAVLETMRPRPVPTLKSKRQSGI